MGETNQLKQRSRRGQAEAGKREACCENGKEEGGHSSYRWLTCCWRCTKRGCRGAPCKGKASKEKTGDDHLLDRQQQQQQPLLRP